MMLKINKLVMKGIREKTGWQVEGKTSRRWQDIKGSLVKPGGDSFSHLIRSSQGQLGLI